MYEKRWEINKYLPKRSGLTCEKVTAHVCSYMFAGSKVQWVYDQCSKTWIELKCKTTAYRYTTKERVKLSWVNFFYLQRAVLTQAIELFKWWSALKVGKVRSLGTQNTIIYNSKFDREYMTECEVLVPTPIPYIATPNTNRKSVPRKAWTRINRIRTGHGNCAIVVHRNRRWCTSWTIAQKKMWEESKA